MLEPRGTSCIIPTSTAVVRPTGLQDHLLRSIRAAGVNIRARDTADFLRAALNYLATETTLAQTVGIQDGKRVYDGILMDHNSPASHLAGSAMPPKLVLLRSRSYNLMLYPPAVGPRRSIAALSGG